MKVSVSTKLIMVYTTVKIVYIIELFFNDNRWAHKTAQHFNGVDTNRNVEGKYV